MEQHHQTRHFDERDSLFARARLIKGTAAYRDYYRRFPERLQTDEGLRHCGGLVRLDTAGAFNGEQIRELTPRPPGRLLQVLMRALPPVRSSVEARMKAQAETIPDHLPDTDLIQALIDDSTPVIRDYLEADRRKRPAARRLHGEAGKMANVVKQVAKFYGAALVGVVEMEDHHYYTHHASGEPVGRDFKYAVVFAVVMDRDMINRAPNRETLLATCNGYIDAAHTGARLSAYIKSLGYETSLSCMVSYDVPLVQLAERAGIGQIGRCNFIVTKEYGNSVRLGAVLTNLPLEVDVPDDFGLKDFCMLCGKCAANCPANALSDEEPQLINGCKVWDHDEVACMHAWMEFGTDCGICIASCPFTQGVDMEKVNTMKGNPDIMMQILREDADKHGTRACSPHPLPIAEV